MASTLSLHRHTQDPDDSSDNFEYGDREMALSRSDSSDFSLHQFMEQDDGREGSSTSDDDTGNAEIVKQHAMAADDHFNSEDTPDTTDSFLQRASRKRHSKQEPDDTSDNFEYGDKEMAVSQGDSSDFSLHQFMEHDDGREGSSTSDDDTGNAEIAKQHAVAADDHFDSEDMPDATDSFLQKNSKKRRSRQDPDDTS